MRAFALFAGLSGFGILVACGPTGVDELDQLLAELDPEPDPEPEPAPEPEPRPAREPDETPPLVEITGPEEPCLAEGEAIFSFKITDEESEIGIVRVELSGAMLDVVDGGEGSYTAAADTGPLFEGLHTLIVTAIDTSNNLGEAERVYGKVDEGGYFVAAEFACGEPPDAGLVDTEPPTVEIVSPVALELVGDSVEVRVAASDDVGPLSVRATVLGDADEDPEAELTGAGGLFTGTLDTSGLPEVSAAIEVEATDGADRSATASVTVQIDHTPPAVSVVQPASGASVVALTDVVAEATDDNGIERVLLLEGGEVRAIAVMPSPNDPDRWALFYNLPCAGLPRDTTFEVQARDRAGNVGTATVDVTVTEEGCSDD